MFQHLSNRTSVKLINEAWASLLSENYEKVCYNSYIVEVWTRYLWNINLEYYHATNLLDVVVEVEYEYWENSLTE
jgi:hypothetical protein